MLFASKNYVLAYQQEGLDYAEPLLWDVEFRPMLPQNFTFIGRDRAFHRFDNVEISYQTPLVNINACRIMLDNLADTWNEIPDLVLIEGYMPSAERYKYIVSNIGIHELIQELKIVSKAAESEVVYIDWEKISFIYHVFGDEKFRWAHMLIYANRFNPESITLAPIMRQEIIDTICNYYHFANWVLTACKIDPVRFKSENFVLLRIN